MARKTRHDKAAELMDKLNNGPSFSFSIAPSAELGITPAQGKLIELEASRQFRLWADTWVKQLALDLVPELKQR